MLHPRIHGLGLLINPLLDRIEIRTDQLDRLGKSSIRARVNFLGGPSCEIFHKVLSLIEQVSSMSAEEEFTPAFSAPPPDELLPESQETVGGGSHGQEEQVVNSE